MKYGSEGFEGCDLVELCAASLRSALELVTERLMELFMDGLLLEFAAERSCDELPTYRSPNQQDPR